MRSRHVWCCLVSRRAMCGREVFFEVNSVPRVVEVLDRSEEQKGSVGRKAARERADTSNLGSVAAPMAGEVVDVKAKPGAASLSALSMGCAGMHVLLCCRAQAKCSAWRWWHHVHGNCTVHAVTAGEG